MDLKQQRIHNVILKRELADIVVKNGKIVNVFTQDIVEADIAIVDGVIVAIGSYEGKTTINANGYFITPGLMDGHVHIESAMVKPSEFANVVLPHGVTTIIADPHEIANVNGLAGIDFMLEDASDLPLDILYKMPSCVPATSFENSGAILRAKDLKDYYHHPKVVGLGEVMDYPSVANGDADMFQKLADAKEMNKHIDGHAAGLGIEALNLYTYLGIETDHEAINEEEILQRLQLGMYTMLRQGSAAKDLIHLLPAINEKNFRRALFVTDDRHLDELKDEGSIDHAIRLAISKGLDPVMAITMATLNVAECFKLNTKGAIAPGYEATFLFVKDLTTFDIDSVYVNGELVAKDGEMTKVIVKDTPIPNEIKQSVHLKEITSSDLQLETTSNINVIEIIPNKIVTGAGNYTVEASSNFESDLTQDLLKIACINRHKDYDSIGLGIVKGFNIKNGAIAQTIAHDSHHLIVTGTSDKNMLVAIDYIRENQGGMVVVSDEKVIAHLPLSISGLMSEEKSEYVFKQIKEINAALESIGCSMDFNPLVTLSFLALPVIPSLKITDEGLFDVVAFQPTTVNR